jgi:hypothetical protein
MLKLKYRCQCNNHVPSVKKQILKKLKNNRFFLIKKLDTKLPFGIKGLKSKQKNRVKIKKLPKRERDRSKLGVVITKTLN